MSKILKLLRGQAEIELKSSGSVQCSLLAEALLLFPGFSALGGAGPGGRCSLGEGGSEEREGVSLALRPTWQGVLQACTPAPPLRPAGGRGKKH